MGVSKIKSLFTEKKLLLVHTLGYLLQWKSICECQCIKTLTVKDISTSKLLPCTIFHLFSLCWRLESIYLFQGKQAAGSEEAVWAFLTSLLHSEGTGTCGHQDKQLQGTAVSLAVPPGIKSGLGDMLRHFSLKKNGQGKAHKAGELHFNLFITQRCLPKLPSGEDTISHTKIGRY